MRTKAGEKERRRGQILAAAARFLKEAGRDRAPVDQIMSEAGLTSGALYSHFASKEDLFAQTVLAELDRIIAFHKNKIAQGGGAALEAFVEQYLSPKHLDNLADGCVFCALGADLSRSDAKTKALYAEKIEQLIQVFSVGLPGATEKERVKKANAIFSSMIGAIVLARSAGKGPVAARILKDSHQHVAELFSKGAP